MRSKENIILHRLLKEEKRRDGRRTRTRTRSRKRSHQHITGSECKGLISRSTTSKRLMRDRQHNFRVPQNHNPGWDCRNVPRSWKAKSETKNKNNIPMPIEEEEREREDMKNHNFARRIVC
jgi:hypothetical protein